MGSSDEIVVATTLSRSRSHSNEGLHDVADFEKKEPSGSDVATADKHPHKQSQTDKTSAETIPKERKSHPEANTESFGAEDCNQPTPSARSPNTEKNQNTETPEGTGISKSSPPTGQKTTQTDRSAQPAQAAQNQGQKQWKNVSLTATSIVSTQDARKKVRQVLSLLRSASEQSSAKVNALRTAMAEDADHDRVTPKISRVAIRNDIICTIKKCVTMFSTSATNSLPSVARARVRNTILRLPTKWANQLDNATTRNDDKSESAVLASASETLEAITNITNILSESMDRADTWVEKLPNFRLGKRRRSAEAEPEGTPTTEHDPRPKRFSSAAPMISDTSDDHRSLGDRPSESVPTEVKTSSRDGFS